MRLSFSGAKCLVARWFSNVDEALEILDSRLSAMVVEVSDYALSYANRKLSKC